MRKELSFVSLAVMALGMIAVPALAQTYDQGSGQGSMPNPFAAAPSNMPTSPTPPTVPTPIAPSLVPPTQPMTANNLAGAVPSGIHPGQPSSVPSTNIMMVRPGVMPPGGVPGAVPLPGQPSMPSTGMAMLPGGVPGAVPLPGQQLPTPGSGVAVLSNANPGLPPISTNPATIPGQRISNNVMMRPGAMAPVSPPMIPAGQQPAPTGNSGYPGQ